MHTTSDVTEGLYPEEVSNVIQLHPPVAEAVQDLHPLSDEQVLVLPLPLHGVPLLPQVLTPPFQVELQEECPVVLTGEEDRVLSHLHQLVTSSWFCHQGVHNQKLAHHSPQGLAADYSIPRRDHSSPISALNGFHSSLWYFTINSFY